ncbi:MAG: cysteine--tRNA ligase [Kineosporiaceae bacterium]
MSLRLYDSATAEVRDFVPLVEGRAGIYVCGATPQSSPHIGHMRSQVAFDVLRRWLERKGYEVTYIRNVTDIDDKILAKSGRAGRPWWEHAYHFEREFDAAYEAVNVLEPAYQPRATGHIPEMVELVERLIAHGHAYPAADGSGDVYFDVRSWPSYGELTHQSLDDVEPALDADPRAKRDPRDFALWKGAKHGEPATASWPTPWGRGRPGWHLECSAMATRYLGPVFDIHGGGLDLRFPHHENELAQSRAAGDGYARYWLHNAWVVADGEKMSKSLGNTMTMQALLQHVRPAVLRYLLTAAHYRSNIEIGDDDERAARLAEATTAFERIEGFVQRADELLEGAVAEADPTGVALPERFVAAMDDDLAVPAALAVVHDAVTGGNSALAVRDREGAREAALTVRAMTAVLGLDPLDPHWVAGSTLGHHALLNALDSLVRADLDAREAARKERDYMTADTIRDRLRAAGIAVEDTPDGARWTLDVDAGVDASVNPGVDAGVDQAGGRRGRRPGGR